jgi:hypothetical protein
MGKLQKIIKRTGPGWLSMIIGSGWQALEHYDKIEKLLPLPPICLVVIGGLWVWLAKKYGSDRTGAEVLVIRERTTTVEREFIMRRER